MTIEVSKTISIDARNTLVRNRDGLQTKYGISIFFPRDKIRGAYQDMIIRGGPNAIAKAQRDIDTILTEWNDEFKAFKHRQASRKDSRRTHTLLPPYLPTITQHTPSYTSKNKFALLEHTHTPTITHTPPIDTADNFRWSDEPEDEY